MTKQYAGQITKVSVDGRSAVVTLDRQVSGKHFAVINPDTKGRVHLMNGVGCLEISTRVSGLSVDGLDSLRALTVERID